MRRASLVIALGVGMLPTTPLAAQRVSLDQADADHDGLVSRDEYVMLRDRQFGKFDRNGDGVMSSTDFAHYTTRQRNLRKIDRTLGAIDTDGDGVVTREDVHTAGTVLFDRADADGDGFLTRAELRGLRNALAAWRRGDG